MDQVDHKLIKTIYEAALNPDSWQRVAELMAASLGTHQSIILRSNTTGIPETGIYTHGVDTQIREKYVEILDEDVWLDGMLSLKGGAVCRSDQFVELGELQKTRFYQLLCKPAEVAHMGGAVIRNGPKELLLVAAQRTKSLGAFRDDELQRIRQYVLHLEQAATIANTIERLSDEVRALRGALERSPYGFILVDDHLRAHWWNATADGTLLGNDGLMIRQSQIVTGSANTTSLIEKLLKRAIDTSSGAGVYSGGYLSVARPSQRRPYQLTICPVSKDSDWGDKTFAVVLILDPDDPPNLSDDALKKLFMLTTAEVRVSKALAGGQSIREIAECFEVSHNTVRTQVKAILRKCDVRSQAELLQLFARSVTTS